MNEQRTGTSLGEVLLLGTIVGGTVVLLASALQLPNPGDFSGPGAVPALLAILILVLAIPLLVSGIRRLQFSTEAPAGQDLMALMTFVFLTLLYLGLMPRVGYPLSTALFIPAAACALGWRKSLTLTLVTVCWIVFAYLVFFELLDVPKPEAIWLEAWVN